MRLSILPVVLAALIGILFLLPPGTGLRPAPADKAAIRALEFHLRAVAAPALAETPAHGFLIDAHEEAGLGCAACHGAAAFTEPVAMATCTGCHGSYAELAAMTPWEPNPHRSHMGELECSTCHNIHKASESFCDRCHSFGMVVP